jgi:hypothetical protein
VRAPVVDVIEVQEIHERPPHALQSDISNVNGFNVSLGIVSKSGTSLRTLLTMKSRGHACLHRAKGEE